MTRKPGQPSKYKSEYCEMLKDHMSKGHPFETFAARAGVCKATLYAWLKHEEFKEARDIAVMLCYHNWVEFIIAGRVSRQGGANAVVPMVQMFMRNVFGWDRQVELKGVAKEVADMSTDELHSYVKGMLPEEEPKPLQLTETRKLDA